ncbi:MAG: hypothetical protein NZM42_04415 [Gemmatales bacterium]|nr:hypothetical protein [Gemmatales bacterium]
MYRTAKLLRLATILGLGTLLLADTARADHRLIRPRGTVVGYSIHVATPVPFYPAPGIIYDPWQPVIVPPGPVIVQPAPVVVVDPWYPPLVPAYYPSRVTGVYIGTPGIGFYYQRWR